MEKLLNLKYDWRHCKRVGGSPEPLFQLATLIKALHLWYGELNNLNVFTTPWNTEVSDGLEMIEMTPRIQMQIISLHIPETCKENLSQMVDLVKSQLEELLELLPRDFQMMQNISKFLQENIHWTSQGTIDKATTAKKLTQSVDLDVKVRFKIAVEFCLEEQINALSVQLPKDHLESDFLLLSSIASMDGASAAREYFEIHEIEPRYVQCFHTMLLRRNLGASQYFWQYLSDEWKLSTLESGFLPNTSGCDLLFLFTQFNRETKLRILNDEQYRSTLLGQLLYSKIPVFNACIENVLKFMTVSSVVKLLVDNVNEWRLAIISKKKYFRICYRFLQYLSKECEITTLDLESNELMVKAMGDLMLGAKRRCCAVEHPVVIELLKDFIKSVSSEWIREWFSLRSHDFERFLQESVNCELIELIIGSAFPNVEERKTAIDESVIDCILCELFMQTNQMDDTYKVLIFIFSDFENIEHYKRKLVEERRCSFLSRCLTYGYWEVANKFVNWCFATKEEITSFYSEFFSSESFGRFFDPAIEMPVKSTVSLIKSINLEHLLDINDIILNACLAILSQKFILFCASYFRKSKDLFDSLDYLLLAFIHDDQEKLIELKKQLLTYKSKTLHIPLPLESLHERINTLLTSPPPLEAPHEPLNAEHQWDGGSARAELWRLMIKEFFAWISSANETLMAEMEQKFWSSEKILEAEKSFG